MILAVCEQRGGQLVLPEGSLVKHMANVWCALTGAVPREYWYVGMNWLRETQPGCVIGWPG